MRIGELEVRRRGLGAIQLTRFRPAEDRTDAIKVTRHAVELGVNFIDTADSTPLGRRECLRQAAEFPPRRSKVERVDFQQLNRIDPAVPFQDQVDASAQLTAAARIHG